jgi:ABC-type nitrate/sulfonate/bicarbonate transport system permease component
MIEAARTMGLARRRIVTRVVVPAALPSLLVALRLGVALSWTAVVAAELIGAPSGLGFAVEWYRERLATPQVMSFIAMIGVTGYLCDAFVRWLNVRLTPWAVARR